MRRAAAAVGAGHAAAVLMAAAALIAAACGDPEPEDPCVGTTDQCPVLQLEECPAEGDPLCACGRLQKGIACEYRFDESCAGDIVCEEGSWRAAPRP